MNSICWQLLSIPSSNKEGWTLLKEQKCRHEPMGMKMKFHPENNALANISAL